jgi:hypothetical protein
MTEDTEQWKTSDYCHAVRIYWNGRLVKFATKGW